MKHLFYLSVCWVLCFGINSDYLHAQNPGKAFFIEAENLRKGNRCRDAVTKYDEAIQKEPSNYKYYFARGKCEYKLKEFEKAKESFKFTIEFRREYSPAYSLLAKIFKMEKNYEEAMYYYDQAARYERSDARKVHYKLLLVGMLLKDDRVDEARRHIDEARSIDPDNPKILLYNAKISVKYEDWENARRDYERALESDALKSASPAEKAEYYYGLGLAYSKLGDNASARRAWSKANFGPYKKLIQQQMMQTSHVYFYKVALSYYLNGEYNESEQYIDKALELQRDYSKAFILRGKIERKRGNVGRAIDFYQMAIDNEKDGNRKAKMYSMVASLQLSNNDSYGALSSIDRALEASPNNSSLLYKKAKAEYGSGRYADAITTLEKLLAAGVDTKAKARYSFMLGMAARRDGDYEKAKKAFENAMYGPYKPAAQAEIRKMNEGQ
ncbi:MAG: tetratricopeptide repeat protein [Bacteroidota bacterium]